MKHTKQMFAIIQNIYQNCLKNFTPVALLQKRSVRIFVSTYAAVQSARKSTAPTFRVQRICSQVAVITISIQSNLHLLTFTARVTLVRHNLKDVGHLDTFKSQVQISFRYYARSPSKSDNLHSSRSQVTVIRPHTEPNLILLPSGYRTFPNSYSLNKH